VIGAHGVLYGTTGDGGADNAGTVFSLTPPSSPGGAWTETQIHTFTGGSDGIGPAGSLVVSPAGVFYGVTSKGGAYNAGIVYSLTPPAEAGGAWTETVLYTFTGADDGYFPFGGLYRASDGVLIGTTFSGGASKKGVAYQLTPPSSPGGAWTQKVLHTFGIGSDGIDPVGTLTSSGGSFYGITHFGGAYNGGSAYVLTPPSSAGGEWTESVIYSFGGVAGYQPDSTLLAGRGGALYGTCVSGGSLYEGTAFTLIPPLAAGDPWTAGELYNFSIGSGESPGGGLLMIPSTGVLYGATFYGGQYSAGSIFQLTPPASSGGSWSYTLVYSFDGTDGANPGANPVLGPNGVLYGTTANDGTNGAGTVYALTL
jgi:uncharacterized repeat protein (TIGR03803 family)